MNAQTVIEAARRLRSLGWVWIEAYPELHEDYVLTRGWWVLPTAGDVREMRRGDPAPLWVAVQIVEELYLSL